VEVVVMPVGAVVVAAPVSRDGVIGVSWVGPGCAAGTLEHPANSINTANTSAPEKLKGEEMRIRQG
jgi:hypothetical protein